MIGNNQKKLNQRIYINNEQECVICHYLFQNEIRRVTLKVLHTVFSIEYHRIPEVGNDSTFCTMIFNETDHELYSNRVEGDLQLFF